MEGALLRMRYCVVRAREKETAKIIERRVRDSNSE